MRKFCPAARPFGISLLAGLIASLFFSGCMVAESRRESPAGAANPVVMLRMGVAGVQALSKGSAISLDRLEILWTSSANDTVRDTVTSSTSPALNASTASLQIITKNFDLKSLRSWKLVATTRDILDSVVHRDSAFIPALYAGDTAFVSLNLAARYAMYEARFVSLPDSIESSVPSQPKQVLHINRLVLRIDGVTVRDSAATPGPYFKPDTLHKLVFDYVAAGTGSWVTVSTGTTKNLNALQFATSDTGYIAGDTVAYKTVDGGATWSALSGGSPRSMRYVSFINGSQGLLAGDSATVGATSNAGAGWTVLKLSGTTNRAPPVALVDNNLGFGFTISPTPGGSTTVRRTVNGGVGWNITAGFANNVYAVQCVSATACWAAGYAGMIRKNTSEDGYFADVQASGTTRALRGMHFLNANTGWVVGDTGVILKTTNGGSSWSAQAGGTTQNLRAVHFIDTAIGYAVGENGVILATSNGGVAWSPQVSGTTQHLNGVWFSGSTGYVVGNGGTLLKLNDVRAVEMLAYGPFGSWDVSKPLFSGLRYINVASGLDASVSLVLYWRGPTGGTGKIEAVVGKVGKVTVNGEFPGTQLP